MKRHWRSFHLGPGAWDGLPYACPALDCFRKYRVKGKLREHMRNAHHSTFDPPQIEYSLSIM